MSIFVLLWLQRRAILKQFMCPSFGAHRSSLPSRANFDTLESQLGSLQETFEMRMTDGGTYIDVCGQDSPW